MVNPVPGYKVGTKFGVRGKHWSCQKINAAGGIHTGLDIPAPLGTPIVAPIAGTIRHRAYGPAFGSKQFAISPSPGQPFATGEVFFGHTRTRLPDGTEVRVGQKIAEVAADGNATAPHLHLEFMPNTKKAWRCGIHADPQTVIDWNPNPPPPEPTEPEETPVSARIVYYYSGKPKQSQTIGTGYTKITNGRWVAPGDGWVFTMCYANFAHAKGATGGVRHVLVRENPVDETCYGDLAVTKDLVAPGSFLIQPLWFGAVQKGRPYRWELRRSKSLGATEAGTRYVKFLWVSSEAALGGEGRSVAPARPPRWWRLLWVWLRALLSDTAKQEWLELHLPTTRPELSRAEVLAALHKFFTSAEDEGEDPVHLEID